MYRRRTKAHGGKHSSRERQRRRRHRKQQGGRPVASGKGDANVGYPFRAVEWGIDIMVCHLYTAGRPLEAPQLGRMLLLHPLLLSLREGGLALVLALPPVVVA